MPPASSKNGATGTFAGTPIPATSPGNAPVFLSHLCGNGILSGSAGGAPSRLVSWGQHGPKAYVVVGVVRVVVVAIANPAVVGVVVPTAATIHAVRALWTEPQLNCRFAIDDCRFLSEFRPGRSPALHFDFMEGRPLCRPLCPVRSSVHSHAARLDSATMRFRSPRVSANRT